MEMMEDDEPLSSSEAPLAPALDSVQGLLIPVAGPETPFRPTSGMPATGAAACAGPGRSVTGGVHWGVRSVCAGGVRSWPRYRVSVGRGGSGWTPGAEEAGWVDVYLPGAGGGHRGAHYCCAGGMRHAGGMGEGRRHDAAGIRG